MKNAISSINKNYLSFSVVEKKIADYILQNPENVIYMTTAVLSKKINVSQGSIINFSNSLGFNGFSELKLNVAQNIPNREQVISESLCKEDLPHTVLKKLSEEILQTFQMTISALQNSELEHAANIIMQKTHIEIYGVGSSSMIANDAYYRYMRQGFPVIAVTDPHIASVSASLLDENSAIIIISYSGRSMEIVKTAEIAKKKGAAIISVTSFSDSPLAKLSDVCLVSASKEADKNKEAIAARHSQLLILDSLLAYLSLKNTDKAIEYMENVTDIIGEYRMQ